MSTQTTNLNLVKPGDNNALDIADINDNMDTLDAAVGAVDVSTDGSLQEQINDLGVSVSSKVGNRGVVNPIEGTYNWIPNLYVAYSRENKRLYIFDSSTAGTIAYIDATWQRQ